MHRTIPDYYNGMPYLAERWLSVSVFLPADWEDTGNGWGSTVFGIKPRNESGLSGAMTLYMDNGAWRITHRWSPVKDPTSSDVPWQYEMFYAGNYEGRPYPNTDQWPDGLRDFPDVEVSQAALSSLNKGGWTDWIVHFKPDARGAGDGGTGFMSVWKREDSGPWIKVLHIVPKTTTRGQTTFDHGIWYNSPPQSDNNGGFGAKFGLYMLKEEVWNNSRNRVIYLDNVKLGDERSSFSDMSPDGTSPAGGSGGSAQEPAPEAPQLAPVE
jgi:hypothetical protein